MAPGVRTCQVVAWSIPVPVILGVALEHTQVELSDAVLEADEDVLTAGRCSAVVASVLMQ